MNRKASTCPLCGAEIQCDMCGPIEGRPVWIREGERAPSEFREGEPGAWGWACGRCLGEKARP